MRDSDGVPILGSDLEQVRVVHWRACSHIRFSNADIMVCEAYADAVCEVQQVEAGSGTAGVVEDDKDWDLGDIPLSKDADLHASLLVDYAVIQSRCRELSIKVPGNAWDVFGLALQGLQALQAVEETRTRIAGLRATKVELSVKVCVLEDPESGVIDEDCPLELQSVVLNADEERRKALEFEGKMDVTDAKVELENVKEAMRVLEEQASTDRLLTLSAVEDCIACRINWRRPQRLQVGDGALTAAFD